VLHELPLVMVGNFGTPRRHYFPFAFAVFCSGDNPPAFVSGSFGSWSTKALSIKYVPSTVRAAAAIIAKTIRMIERLLNSNSLGRLGGSLCPHPQPDLDQAAGSWLRLSRQVYKHGSAGSLGLSERFKRLTAQHDGGRVEFELAPGGHETGRPLKAGTSAALMADHERKAVAGRAPNFHILDGNTVEVQVYFAAPSADYQTFRDYRFDSELIPRKAAEIPCGQSRVCGGLASYTRAG